jgi:hypothetical protein
MQESTVRMCVITQSNVVSLVLFCFVKSDSLNCSDTKRILKQLLCSHLVGTPWTGESPIVGPLPTQDNTTYKYADVLPFIQHDSKP